MTTRLRFDIKYDRDTGKGQAILRFNGDRAVFPVEAYGPNHAGLVGLSVVLDAITDANTEFGQTEDATIEVRNAYLAAGCNEYLGIWRDNGWQTSDGKLVQYADTWQEIDRFLTGSNVSVVYAHGSNSERQVTS